ncbi:hypothetical protein [Namhaeicola litoreus]|uniref:CarboxypepD_reg-like domain-containing protein n=1 Tax=Namhaeicola litoreus TaxID=1052145 RepID=A0ABW3XZI2_9FLAO
MFLKLFALLLFLSFSAISYAQERKYVELSGRIFVDSTTAENIHIINLTSRRGTTSNELGIFEIPVSLNDTLFFSAINVINRQIVITEKILEKGYVLVHLISSTEYLEEISLKQHQLTGRLSVDVIKARDSVDVVNREALDFSMIRFDDPNSPYFVMSGGNLLNLVFYASKLFTDKDKARGKEIEHQYRLKLQKAPEEIRKEFGDLFFVDTLKIPKEKIDDFILFCTSRGIDHLYVVGRKVEVVDVLFKERNNYKENNLND